jgi:hypothetical protein
LSSRSPTVLLGRRRELRPASADGPPPRGPCAGRHAAGPSDLDGAGGVEALCARLSDPMRARVARGVVAAAAILLALVGGAPRAAPEETSPPPRKVILDTDPGIDDAMAIAFALRSPALQVLGITTVYGNADIELTTANALRMVELLGRDLPASPPRGRGSGSSPRGSPSARRSRFPEPEPSPGTPSKGDRRRRSVAAWTPRVCCGCSKRRSPLEGSQEGDESPKASRRLRATPARSSACSRPSTLLMSFFSTATMFEILTVLGWRSPTAFQCFRG